MFKHLLKNKKAQNTAEYALLIALVVAGIVAMQQYAQRALQARVRDASVYLTCSTGNIGNSVQYEPYYQKSSYDVTKNSVERTIADEGLMATDSANSRIKSGNSTVAYDNTATVGGGSVPTGL